MNIEFGICCYNARMSANLTVSRASELLNIADRTLYFYEHGQRNVSDEIVAKMIDVYNCPLLGYQWLQNTKTGRLILPNIESKNFPETILTLLANLKTTNTYMTDLIDIGQDGKVDDKEQVAFCKIVENLKPMLKTIFSLGFYKKKKLTSR